METVSIIVPIYNVEKYLANCLESLLQQTHKQIEIILINDGSKDNSLDICKAYAQKDPRIKLIDKVNEGVAIARNTGLTHATGDYVAFVDPDDWVEPEMYSNLLVACQKTQSPVCLCNFSKDTKRRSQPKCFDFKQEILCGTEIIEELVNNMIGMSDLLPKYVYIMGCVWRGLYKRSFIETHHLRFEPGLTIMEDLVFMVQTLLKCEQVAIDHGVYYHYVQHATSTLHSYNQKMWDDQLIVYKLLETSIREANLEEEMRNRLDYRYLGMVFSAIKNETYIKNADFKETISHIRDIFTDERLKDVLERVKPIQVEKSEKIEEKKSQKQAKKKTTEKKKKKTSGVKLKTKEVSKKIKKRESSQSLQEK